VLALLSAVDAGVVAVLGRNFELGAGFAAEVVVGVADAVLPAEGLASEGVQSSKTTQNVENVENVENLRLATGGHGATSTKTKLRACPTWTPAKTLRARFATCRRRTHHGGKPRKKQSTAACPWDARSGRLDSGPHALWWHERFARGEPRGHA
jgi:hypothetical protein